MKKTAFLLIAIGLFQITACNNEETTQQTTTTDTPAKTVVNAPDFDAENAYELLKKENDFLRKISDELNGNIRTYENNLGFFKNSKTSNSFMKEIEAKIDTEKVKINELNLKRKLVTEELTKLREVNSKPVN